MKRAALALALLAAALSGGVGRSEAVFVGSSSHPTASFATSGVFNAVSVTLTDPGSPIRGTAALEADASSDRPIAGVSFQTAPAGSGTYTDHCTDAVAPYTCDWDTGALADGFYDVRAIAVDASGYSRTATRANRRIDNTAPAVALAAPASPLTGMRTLTAAASDAGGTGVASVAFEYRTAPDGAWSPICSGAGTPYSCPWDTAARADGVYDLRATATDAAGNAAGSVVSSLRVDNTAPGVTLTDPGTPLGGPVALAATTGDGDGSGVSSVVYQYRATGTTGAWLTACTAAGAPFGCSWSAAPPDGLYDLRATATDAAGLQTISAPVTSRRIDNTAPITATITVPAGTLIGDILLAGAAADTGSGMVSMRFEYKRSSDSTWTAACVDSSPPSPFSCTLAIAGLADGTYDFRSVAIDAAGNTRTSAVVAGRTVDNHGPVTAVTSPGPVRTSTTLSATATDVSAIVSVTFQYRTAGTGAYTTICADTTPAYGCAWNVAALADGPYDVRAVATDVLGLQATSPVVAAHVNNTGPTGTDVQGANGGVNDRLDAGDSLTFTYSQAIAPASILAGWTGAPAAIRVRVNNAGATDSMEFYDAANATPLGLLAPGTSLAIYLDHVTAPTVLQATIARSGTSITVTIGAIVSGAVTSSPKGRSDMVWQTGAQATDLSGKPVFPTTVTESGGKDLDF